MAHRRDFYRLGPTPIGGGGQAKVFRAENKLTGAFVALKQRTGASDAAKDRMRREIDVQSAIQHRNVMPILDFDTELHRWFAMPLAEKTLEELPLPMSVEDLVAVLGDVARGLKAAHADGFVHRDIKPSNVLWLDDEQGARWVVADWGLVRRPVGQTTADHTRTGMALGSEGFAPPESYDDSHDVGFAWDVYSLGRLAAWAATGEKPRPNRDLPAPEPWRRFVRLLTDDEASRRPKDMDRVVELLALVTTELPVVPGVSNETLAAARDGDADSTVEVLRAARNYADDGEFFIDEVARLSGDGLDKFVREGPQDAAALLKLMDRHFEQVPWGRRSFDYYNVPLHWMQRMAEAAADEGQLDLLEDACAALFRHEPRLDRWRQKNLSQEWLASLQGPAAARVAGLLLEQPEAARFYGVLKSAADPRILAALRSGSTRA